MVEAEPAARRHRSRAAPLAQLHDRDVVALRAEDDASRRLPEHAQPEDALIPGERAVEVGDLENDATEARGGGKAEARRGDAVGEGGRDAHASGYMTSQVTANLSVAAPTRQHPDAPSDARYTSTMSGFRLVSPFTPQGDQPQAIAQLVEGFQAGHQEQVLLGVTGSGKTFTVAKMVEALDRPTLVLSHNKTLAAQLYQEFKSFFPDNAVEYFVSYYDYYQPEAYVPQSDTYIEKETTINEDIERLRLRATKSLFERRDVLIVASVSCIYGLGSPESFYDMLLFFDKRRGAGDGRRVAPPGRHAVPAHQHGPLARQLPRPRRRAGGDAGLRRAGHPRRVLRRRDRAHQPLRPAARRGAAGGRPHRRLPAHPLRDADATRMQRAMVTIRDELDERLAQLHAEDKLLEAQRLEQRTRFDLEMLKELGHCQGIENYSRHLTGRAPGEPPPTLLDYLPEGYLLVIDESHQTVPQVRGMYHGDRSRKETLVEYGFRLPSALDNRPLTFDEFDKKVGQRLYVSATPSPLRAASAPAAWWWSSSSAPPA